MFFALFFDAGSPGRKSIYFSLMLNAHVGSGKHPGLLLRDIQWQAWTVLAWLHGPSMSELAWPSQVRALPYRSGTGLWPGTVAAPVSALDNCNSAQILLCSCDDYTNGPHGAISQFAYATLALARVYQAKCMTMLWSPCVSI